MSAEHPQHKIVVFDTNQYAGNFEREMCAFITGRVGQCQVGEDIARQVKKDLRHRDWYDNCIAYEVDGCGCARPAAMWRSPAGRSANGVAIFVQEFPPDEVMAEMVDRANLFCAQNRLRYMGYRLLEPHYEIRQVRAVPA